MKVSLEQRIFRYLKSRPMKRIHGGELEELAQSAGYMGSTASRRARDLAGRGAIKREKVNGSEVYWYTPVTSQMPLGAMKTLTLAV